MPRPARGQTRRVQTGWEARITVGHKQRRCFMLPTCETEDEAKERTAYLAGIAARLRKVGRPPDTIATILDIAAERTTANLDEVERAVVMIERGDSEPVPEAPRDVVTIRELGEQWTEGLLAKQYPDHVREKKSAKDDSNRLNQHVYPIVGNVDVSTFTLDDADRVMSALPEHLSRNTRRQVGQTISRLMNLAVYPCRLRETSPIPRGWLPDTDKKTKAFLYPDEEAALLRLQTVPLAARMVHAFLAREGTRKREALGLTWGEVDLRAGTVTVEDTKDDDSRTWVLGEDVAEALRRWRKLRGDPDQSELVFGVNDVRPEDLRRWLLEAGVDRKQLHTKTDTRDPYNVHAHRGTFVTLQLAMGRSEAWISDRTGHDSSEMIRRYKRRARSAADIRLGWLHPMHLAIPELRHPDEGDPTDPEGVAFIGPGKGHDGYRRSDLNRHTQSATDFESVVSTNSTTPASCRSRS